MSDYYWKSEEGQEGGPGSPWRGAAGGEAATSGAPAQRATAEIEVSEFRYNSSLLERFKKNTKLIRCMRAS